MGRKSKQQLEEEKQAFFEVKLLDYEIVEGHTRFSTLNSDQIRKLLVKYPKCYKYVRKNLVPLYKITDIAKDNISILEEVKHLKFDTFKITSLLTSKPENFYNDYKFNLIMNMRKEELNIYDISRLTWVYSDAEGIKRITDTFSDTIFKNVDKFHHRTKLIFYMMDIISLDDISNKDWRNIFDYSYPVMGIIHQTHKDFVNDFMNNKLKTLAIEDQKRIINQLYSLNKQTDPIRYRNYLYTNGSAYNIESLFSSLRETFDEQYICDLLNFEKLGTLGIEDIVNSDIKSYIDFSKIKNKTVMNKIITKIISDNFSSIENLCSVKWDTIKNKKTLEYVLFLSYELGNWITVSVIGSNCDKNTLDWDMRRAYGILDE